MISLITVAIATDGDGDFSTVTPEAFGRLLQYRYVVDGTSPLATGTDIDIVGTTTGFVYVNQDNIGTSSFTKAPRQPTHDSAGVASETDDTTGEPVEDYMFIGGESLTVTIDEGGASKVGTLYLWIG